MVPDLASTNRAKAFTTSRQSPKTFCPSEVARALTHPELQALGYSCWREAMPDIRSILFTMRENNDVEILQKGVVLEGDLGPRLANVVGPIRVRKSLA
ncbi:hypothetical protein BPOR_0267g00110 [Botrytis porri]|uniref:Uncharacterized protein n=1 Tax=Botrytis porri TaxID=87229 RepID=A0A4Z1KQL7_9HELO|nr:hypothetical protein BPOR_0267g00110 [Botrytis porri]